MDPLLPNFQDSGAYVKYYGTNIVNSSDNTKRYRYIRLLEREEPLRYQYAFPLVANDAKGASVTFNDLDPAQGHVYQVFLGVGTGVRVQVFTPFDTRLLNWDTPAQNISPDQTAVLSHNLSPYEAPCFDFWIPPNKQYPAMVPINVTSDLFPGGKSIIPKIIFIAASFRVEMIEQAAQPELFDMLEKKKIPSTPIRFGGTIRSIPR